MYTLFYDLIVGAPAVLSGISTPLISTVWETELAHHPSPTFAHYIVNGIRQGFRIGCSRQLQLISASRNMASALEHPEVVSEYLRQELLLNRMVIIPRSHLPLIQSHISPFGVIPKRAKPGKWRLIVDLSSPANASVNDGINRESCSITYITIDHIVDIMLQLGKGTLMAKADIKQAYRIVPVHPDDRHLLCVQWGGQIIADKVLPS